MERLQRLMSNAQAGMGAEPGQDHPTADNSEMVYISSLSLLKVNGRDVYSEDSKDMALRKEILMLQTFHVSPMHRC